MQKIAIFASGRGSNAKKIIDHFENISEIEVALILSNRADAKVLDLAKNHSIPSHISNREEFYNSRKAIDILKYQNIDLIVLAGFLWRIPQNLVDEYPDKIINIHPALLPKYGGKGMYGRHVHEAVFEQGESESGISIHFVNENYDEGQIIFQAHCQLDKKDTAEVIAQKVLHLEHKYYPIILEKILRSLN